MEMDVFLDFGLGSQGNVSQEKRETPKNLLSKLKIQEEMSDVLGELVSR
jgi:hypothetical protein